MAKEERFAIQALRERAAQLRSIAEANQKTVDNLMVDVNRIKMDAVSTLAKAQDVDRAITVLEEEDRPVDEPSTPFHHDR